jgi:LemA protein
MDTSKLPKYTIPLAIVVVLFLYLISSYNGLINKQETVNSQWSQVQNVYQRRLDLIPNLVSTVSGYAKHEQATLTAVIEARSKLNSVQVNANDLSPEKLQAFNQAQQQLGTGLSRLMLVAEQYPQLKANENFLNLQAQLEGTENRIANERRMFNEATQDYNISIKKFPTNIMAMIFAFQTKPYFEADKSAEKAPEVKF